MTAVDDPIDRRFLFADIFHMSRLIASSVKRRGGSEHAIVSAGGSLDPFLPLPQSRRGGHRGLLWAPGACGGLDGLPALPGARTGARESF